MGAWQRARPSLMTELGRLRCVSSGVKRNRQHSATPQHWLRENRRRMSVSPYASIHSAVSLDRGL
jgi:hypothetical protein